MTRIWTLLLLLVMAPAWSATRTVPATGEGFGNTADLAVGNALVEAVRQAGGATIALNPDFRRQIREFVVEQRGDTVVWGSHSTSVPEPRIATLGNVKSYTIDSVTQQSERLWRAVVKAEVLVLESVLGDRSHLPSIAVEMFSSVRDTFNLNKDKVSAAAVLPRLQSDIVNALTQSGRFRVLDRQGDSAFAREAAVLQRTLDPVEKAKQARELGADLIVTGVVEDFSIGTGNKEFYGASFNDFKPRFRVRYRVIETATREIIWSDTFSYQSPQELLRDRFIEITRDYPNEPEQLAFAVYPDVARAIADGVVDTLFPVQVVSVVDEQQIYVSQGAGRMVAGDRFALHRRDQTIADPDTGMAVQLETDALAKVEVSRAAKGFAIVGLVEGDMASVQVGDVLRRIAPQAQVRDVPPPRSTPGSSDAPIQW